MHNADPLRTGAFTEIAIGVIDGIDDIAVFHVFPQFLYGHDRAVVLGLLGGSAQMRDHDTSLLACRHRIGEIGDIALHFPFLQGFDHGVLIHEHVSCKVAQNHIFLHLGDRLRIDHSLRGIHRRYMNGDKITLRIDLIQILAMADTAGKVPSRIHGYIRVVSEHIHAELDSRIGHTYTDGTQADHAELLAVKLRTCIGLLLFLRHGSDLRIVCFALYPMNAVYDPAAGKEHTGQNQLLYTVGIGTRRIKDNDTFFRALLQRDVVHARAGSGNGNKILGKFHIMHLGGTHQDRLRLCNVLRLFVLLVKNTKSHICNGI